jgi:hypothetical protein
MEYVSIVFYKGAKAYYKITSDNGRLYQAILQHYEGKDYDPPKKLTFFKEDNACLGDADTIDLISDISDGMEQDQDQSLNDILHSLKKKKPE